MVRNEGEKWNDEESRDNNRVKCLEITNNKESRDNNTMKCLEKNKWWNDDEVSRENM